MAVPITRKTVRVADAVAFPPSPERTSDIYRLAATPLFSADTGASSARQTLAGATLIRVTSVEDTFIAFGDSGIVAAADATSHLFLRGSEYFPVPLDTNGVPYTYIAYLQNNTAGKFQVSKVL